MHVCSEMNLVHCSPYLFISVHSMHPSHHPLIARALLPAAAFPKCTELPLAAIPHLRCTNPSHHLVIAHCPLCSSSPSQPHCPLSGCPPFMQVYLHLPPLTCALPSLQLPSRPCFVGHAACAAGVAAAAAPGGAWSCRWSYRLTCSGRWWGPWWNKRRAC